MRADDPAVLKFAAPIGAYFPEIKRSNSIVYQLNQFEFRGTGPARNLTERNHRAQPSSTSWTT
jgi:hypothetical protein